MIRFLSLTIPPDYEHSFTGFVKPGFLLSHKDKGDTAAVSSTVSPAAPSMESKGLTDGSVELSPFLFDYDEEKTLSVKEAGVEKASNGDWQITAYGFDFDGQPTAVGTMHPQLHVFGLMPLSMCAAFLAGARLWNEAGGGLLPGRLISGRSPGLFPDPGRTKGSGRS